MFVLGIDPGLSRCGYGVLQQDKGKSKLIKAVAAGVIRTSPKTDLAIRLAELQQEIRALIDEYKPDEVAIERVLFQVNVSSAMATGQAAGVAMAAAASSGCAVNLYSPNEVKLAVAGWGGADKKQMEHMVQTLLSIKKPLRPVDAADAVAVALCHLAMKPSSSILVGDAK
tara:strand:- start:398 stop:907 length:510 start_codon:yes stop_codon:yes gene_type:complete